MPSGDLIRELLEGGFLKKQSDGAGGAKKLLERALKDLKTGKANLEIDEEAAYTFAYLAMLRSGRALLFLKGYRPADGRQHRTVVEAAGLFLGKRCEDLAYEFERMRRTRNQFTYEPDLPLGLKETQDALAAAEEFVRRMLEAARKADPQMDLDI